MMHSQATEYQAADLAVERDSLLLLAASRETSRTQAECLSLHSINALEGMFAPKCVTSYLHIHDHASFLQPCQISCGGLCMLTCMMITHCRNSLLSFLVSCSFVTWEATWHTLFGRQQICSKSAT